MFLCLSATQESAITDKGGAVCTDVSAAASMAAIVTATATASTAAAATTAAAITSGTKKNRLPDKSPATAQDKGEDDGKHQQGKCEVYRRTESRY